MYADSAEGREVKWLVSVTAARTDSSTIGLKGSEGVFELVDLSESPPAEPSATCMLAAWALSRGKLPSPFACKVDADSAGSWGAAHVGADGVC